MDKYAQYTKQIVGAITSTLDEDSEHFIAEMGELDATLFFTAILGATTYVFNDFTGESKSNIDMTHTLNGLAVQHAVDQVKGDE